MHPEHPDAGPASLDITKNIKIGCGFNIAPMWHPLRMAEDYTTADWLTEAGSFGVGRGYHTREVEVFGALAMTRTPTASSSRSRSNSSSNRSTSVRSRTRASYTIPPPQVPYRGYELAEINAGAAPEDAARRVLAACISASARALDFMARHNIKESSAAAPRAARTRRWCTRFARRAPAPDGRPSWVAISASGSFYIADSVEQGIKEATPFFEENIKMFAPSASCRA